MRLFVTVRYICSWLHQFISKEGGKHQRAIQKKFTFIVAKLDTGKETTLASTADILLSKLNKQDIKKMTAKLCQDIKDSPSKFSDS